MYFMLAWWRQSCACSLMFALRVWVGRMVAAAGSGRSSKSLGMNSFGTGTRSSAHGGSDAGVRSQSFAPTKGGGAGAGVAASAAP